MIAKVLARIPFGRRQLQQAQLWIPSACLFGAGAAAAGLYLSDWQLVNQFIPFYNSKFKTEE